MASLAHSFSAGKSAMVGERIVIVEDESVVALNLRLRLEAAEYQIAGVADSAAAALTLVENTLPDLVLMDIQLKGKPSGLEAAETIRDRWNIPIIYLTAHTTPDILDQVKSSQPYGYLLKPFDATELYSTINIALEQHRSRAQLQALNAELERRVRERTEELEAINQRLKIEIAERKRAEAEAIHALDKERELNDLRSRFITTTSHEFRTPLSIVLTSAELLERFGSNCPPERQERYFQKIREAVQSMTAILTDMLTLGKADAGTLEFKPMHFDLKKFCHSVLANLQIDQHKHPSVSLDYQSDRTQVFLDPELLNLILNNLLSNSIKYSMRGGEIHLRVNCSDEIATLQIEDHGIGIPQEDMPHLFESFHRARNVDTIAGTGLGLSIAHRCVELQGGQIQIESELGKGTIVTVHLPINHSEVEAHVQRDT
jgi:signal transduction histidine kinase